MPITDLTALIYYMREIRLKWWIAEKLFFGLMATARRRGRRISP